MAFSLGSARAASVATSTDAVNSFMERYSQKNQSPLSDIGNADPGTTKNLRVFPAIAQWSLSVKNLSISSRHHRSLSSSTLGTIRRPRR